MEILFFSKFVAKKLNVSVSGETCYLNLWENAEFSDAVQFYLFSFGIALFGQT